MVTPNSDSIVVVCGADNAFAMPLAVMVRSALSNLSPERRILLYVIDGGITKRHKRKILKSWDLERITVEWLMPSISLLKNMKVSGHVSVATYFRILIPLLLPEKLHKAIYLDCDMIVMGDLGQLWDFEFHQSYLLAVQDVTLPYMCSSIALKNYKLSAPYLTSDTALVNYRELGILPECKYFNAGVLVINLNKWREDNISRKVINYLEQNRENVRYWDQDGLNAVLFDKWSELDPRWNQMTHIYHYPSWRESPLDEETYNQVISEPKIIHFAWKPKPWHYDGSHPARDIFFNYLDMTEWSGWRPKNPFKKTFLGRNLKRIRTILRRAYTVGR